VSSSGRRRAALVPFAIRGSAEGGRIYATALNCLSLETYLTDLTAKR